MSTVDRLRRWEQFGGSWRVVARDDEAITVALCRCDGGEELERLSAADDDLVAFVGDRTAGP
ncbi:MAG TPA: hypothetical protein VGN18_00020 [Jatrophihabitans sp.]|jgi:hypothetical protein|uniref:hypothetical protein n=1 Tax=Jatrophihabitans sp. TaxID=1932789 RepID=UPI002E033B1D|nr:hypothetical protein [Jatrophihabitans sp.]